MRNYRGCLDSTNQNASIWRKFAYFTDNLGPIVKYRFRLQCFPRWIKNILKDELIIFAKNINPLNKMYPYFEIHQRNVIICFVEHREWFGNPRAETPLYNTFHFMHFTETNQYFEAFLILYSTVYFPFLCHIWLFRYLDIK